MNSSLNWLKGKTLANVRKQDFSWFFTFTGGGSVATEQLWRLVNPQRLVVASEDHEQLFGLKEPVDATSRVMATIGTKKLIDYSCSKVCSDLILNFEDEIQIEFLNTSGGYESWRAENNNMMVVSQGGGRLSKFTLSGNQWIHSPL
jgi:hypothetical protein